MKRFIPIIALALAASACDACDGTSDCPTKAAFVFTGNFKVATDLPEVPLWVSYEGNNASCADGNQIGTVAWDEDDSKRGQVTLNSAGEWMVHVNVDEIESDSVVLGWLECKYVTLTDENLDDEESECSEASG